MNFEAQYANHPRFASRDSLLIRKSIEQSQFGCAGGKWIKRKKRRWVARLERMPLLEKQALLSALEISSPSAPMLASSRVG